MLININLPLLLGGTLLIGISIGITVTRWTYRAAITKAWFEGVKARPIIDEALSKYHDRNGVTH